MGIQIDIGDNRLSFSLDLHPHIGMVELVEFFHFDLRVPIAVREIVADILPYNICKFFKIHSFRTHFYDSSYVH